MGRTTDYVFTPKDIRNLVDITYKQLEYWDKTDLIKPSIGTNLKVRLYSLVDLVFLYLVKSLRDTNNKKYSIQFIRSFLPEFKEFFESNEDHIYKSCFVFLPKHSFVVLGEVFTPKNISSDFVCITTQDFIKSALKMKK